MRHLGWIFGAVIALIVVAFAIQNHDSMVDLWPLPRPVPGYLVILASVAVGYLVGTFFMWVSQSKWRRLARKRKRQLATLDAEIASLRTRTWSGGDSLPAVTPPPSSEEPLPPGAGS